ncbi:adenylosuccinate synthase [soil metagenome]
MPTLVIVGAQWGDEAKGKLVDVLGSQADVVVRYSGGNNAGHTVITGGLTYKFQLIPAGILHPGTVAIIGSGMVVDPKGLLDELDRTLAQKSDLGELLISSSAHVVFPYHRMLDALEEEARGENKIGTTSRGIGPAYQDKVARFGIRMGELVNPDIFKTRLREVLDYKNRLLTMFGSHTLEFEPLFEEYTAYAERLRPFVRDTEIIAQVAVEAGKKVLFEGAQGTFLDLDSGTYPYVTSSHPISGGACLGTGIGPRALQNILGVCKAYTTRVGSGPFPTELDDGVGEFIRDAGQEYGTVTGRGRRCGWLDLVLLRQAARLNSLSGFVLTRLDVLSGLEKLLVCTGYKFKGEVIDHIPANIWDFAEVEPIFVELEGWSENLRDCRSLDDLPAAARRYLEFVEEQTKTPVAILSIGPDRTETIVIRTELIWG